MTSVALVFTLGIATSSLQSGTDVSRPGSRAVVARRAADSPAVLETQAAPQPSLTATGRQAPIVPSAPPLLAGFDTLPDAFARASPVSFTPTAAAASGPGGARGGPIEWRPLLRDSLVLLTVQHAFRAAFEDGTWHETTTGVFWDDYAASVKTLCCWDDGDKFSTNYLFHPLMGSTAAFVFANNHGDSRASAPGSRRYWSAKGKALAYITVYSAYFEIGPVLSESAIGNVGLTPGQQTWGDFVVTPVVGLGVSMVEDVLQLKIVDKVRRRHRAWGNTLSVVLNPTRAVANVMGGAAPWRVPPGVRRSY